MVYKDTNIYKKMTDNQIKYPIAQPKSKKQSQKS